MKTIAPQNVISELKKYILVDGFHIVADLEKSHDSYVVDAVTGKEYLDCYSQFASQALGWNHPALLKGMSRFGKTMIHKIANSDMYTQEYAEFVELFSSITSDFSHYFFIDGGALAIENALKAAFDWKSRKLGYNCGDSDMPPMDVIHLKHAFHGRTGYTLSLTNTGEDPRGLLKTALFPKFDWTRITNPSKNWLLDSYEEVEKMALKEAEDACQRRDRNVAAIIVEPILGEGGNICLETSFLAGLRELADKYEAMLIFDEVQTGLGLTGTWWAYQQHNIVPDMLCFGKKTQVCGFCSTDRIDKIVKANVFHESGRINSTWGGNIVDMVRASIIIETIRDDNLCENAREVGSKFKQELLGIERILNVRGEGLMLAFDLPTPEIRDKTFNSLLENGLLALKCSGEGIRFRPHLTFTESNVEEAISIIKKTITPKKKKSWLSIFNKKDQ